MGQMEHFSDRLVTCWQRVVIGLILLLAAWVSPAGAQTGENVLVIVNGASRASDEIGDYYARKRAIPGDQVLRLTLPSTEQISRAVYESQIERPIATWLTTHAAQDRILYLVLTKDVPLRISGSNGPDGTIASVDSELTLVYRKIAGNAVSVAGSVENPYFAGDRPVAEAKPFPTNRRTCTWLRGWTATRSRMSRRSSIEAAHPRPRAACSWTDVLSCRSRQEIDGS